MGAGLLKGVEFDRFKNLMGARFLMLYTIGEQVEDLPTLGRAITLGIIFECIIAANDNQYIHLA